MNWGYKIIVVYCIFVAGMLFLAFKASTQNKELVTEDYYAQELVYQQKIDETRRAALLTEPVNILLANHEIIIHFPKDFAAKEITGEAVLYCPADKSKDMRQQFSVTDTAVNFKIPENYKGLHYIKISWHVASLGYYYEQKIII